MWPIVCLPAVAVIVSQILGGEEIPYELTTQGEIETFFSQDQ